MHPLWILLIGVIIVIGGVLVLRLHAFLALILAALVVGALTPSSAVYRHALEKQAVEPVTADVRNGRLLLRVNPETGPMPGMQYLVLRESTGGDLAPVATLEVERLVTREGGDEVAEAIISTDSSEFTRVEPRDLIVHPLVAASASDLASETVGERVAAAFGDTAAKIGILIAMAAIIGKCLLDSGAADRIVRSALKLLGERGAPAAFLGSGFLLGIPVFFDTVFYLMIPLGKALRMRTGRNYLLYVLSIVAGATMAHSLVPPTPGPLFVAEQLGVDLGVMIMAGTVVGLLTSSSGFLFARFANARWELPLRESPDFSLEALEELTHRDESQLPPFSLSLLPIVLPVVLIAGATLIDSMDWDVPASVRSAADALGNKNIALVLAAAVAMAMLVWQRRTSRRDLATAVQGALASGGVIILITAAGGAFGAILQQTGVASLIRNLPQVGPLVIIALAFFITTAIRTAQGSATVAMITSVGVLYPLADQLPFHPVYLALAIGCGSKPIAWMNDSGFWVICKMSGMTEAEGLRFVTPMSIIMGATGLLATMAGAMLLPLK